MSLKDFKEGELVKYNDKTYFFDCYEEDYKVRILLIEDDEYDMMLGSKCLKAFTVKIKDVQKYTK